MSRLTSCCNCGCDEPTLPDWSLYGTAQKSGFVLGLFAQGDIGVASIENVSMVVASVTLDFGIKNSARVATNTTIEIGLWCDSDGNSPQAIVRLKADVGEKFCSQHPRGDANYVEPVMPSSHFVARDADAIRTTIFNLGDEYTRSSWRSVVLMLELVVNGVTKQSVQVPAIETGWGTLSRSAIQVFAAREGSDLDVAVAISDDFEFFPTYNSPENTLDAAANVRRSLGFDVPTQWHLFDPITDLGDTGQKKSAAVSLARKDSLDDQDASQGFVESVIYGYQISDTHNPGVPADTSKWCDTQDEEYVPPEALPNNEDPTWESISWVHTPCTRWNRVSRITQALDEPPYPASLSVRFPDSDIVLAYLTPDVRDVFGLGLLGNTIELLGQKDGQILSDNCFWYEDEPAVESETIRCNSVQVSAVLGVEVGRGMYAANQTFAPAAPCDDVYGVFGWRARLFLNIVAILEDKSSHAKSLYRGLIELSMNMNSKFMRGDEVRSFGRAVFDNAPVGLVRFSQDGFLRLFPESPSGDRPPTTISGRLDWLCYSDASANPPIDYEDPLFPWWRVRLI